MRHLHIAFIFLAVFVLHACGAATSTGSDVTRVQTAPQAIVESESSESVAVPSSEEDVSESKVTEVPIDSSASVLAQDADVEENAVQDASEVAAPAVVAAPVSDASSDDEVPADFIRCEVKIEQEDTLYQAQAIGPTLEEARDNAVDEACALPCAVTLESVAEEALEEALERCTEACTENTIVVAAECHQNGKSIYTEGAWDKDGYAAPTNGEEAPKTATK